MGFLDKVESMFIAVDFDGTIVMHEYPGLGAPVPGALETILRWIDEGKKIILSTMRSGTRGCGLFDSEWGYFIWGQYQPYSTFLDRLSKGLCSRAGG